MITCLLDGAVWAVVVFAMFNSGSGPATRGLDEAAGYVVTGLLLATTAPAIALSVFGRAQKTALMLALAFLVAFAALFIAAIIAFS
jgi:hypothetical protein